MGEFEEKLNAFLSNPDAMAQVMNLAQSLNLGGSGSGEAAAGQGEGQPPPPPQDGGGILGGLGGLEGLGDLLGNLDPNMISRLLPLVGELTSENGNDERWQLLYALRPFLKPERRDKVERAVKTAKLIHAGKKLLAAMGESHV
ncbi:MAG: hypothetical protein HFF80_09985 [Oscillospiraceae bacterium]|nr:hypothetical protein [Oscillospiraceae bacterium]